MILKPKSLKGGKPNPKFTKDYDANNPDIAIMETFGYFYYQKEFVTSEELYKRFLVDHEEFNPTGNISNFPISVWISRNYIYKLFDKDINYYDIIWIRSISLSSDNVSIWLKEDLAKLYYTDRTRYNTLKYVNSEERKKVIEYIVANQSRLETKQAKKTRKAIKEYVFMAYQYFKPTQRHGEEVYLPTWELWGKFHEIKPDDISVYETIAMLKHVMNANRHQYHDMGIFKVTFHKDVDVGEMIKKIEDDPQNPKNESLMSLFVRSAIRVKI